MQRALSAHVAASPDLAAAEAGVAGALCFCLSVALQRSQKGASKRRPYKGQRKASAAAAEAGAASRSERDAAVGPARYCSPRHRMPFNSRNESSQCVSMP